MITSLRQIDGAFKKHLEGLTITNAEGEEVLVPVHYINPEGEFQCEHYPAIVIFRSGAYPDQSRYSNNTYTISEDTSESGRLRSRKVIKNPEPYQIFYSVRLYYNYQSDGEAMNTFMMKQFKIGAYLEIEGGKYDTYLISYKNPNSTYREFGIIDEKKGREFIDQYLYRVDINLYDGEVIDEKYLKPIEEGGGIVLRTELENYGNTKKSSGQYPHIEVIEIKGGTEIGRNSK